MKRLLLLVAVISLLIGGLALGGKLTSTYKADGRCIAVTETEVYFVFNESYWLGNKREFTYTPQEGERFEKGKVYTLVMSSNGTDTPTDDTIKSIRERR